MNLPPLQGKISQSGFFIYAAADTRYFDDYGRALINSVLKNTAYGIHVHVFNPTDKQLKWCEAQQRLSVSWEYIAPDQFDSAIQFWNRTDLPEPYAGRKNKMLGLKQATPADLVNWLHKTYYACMRFVRLAELLQTPQHLLEIDIDGLVRSDFPTQLTNHECCDVYVYEKTKKDKVTGEVRKTGHLAGSILITDKPEALSFVKELGSAIRQEIIDDNIYWFLDQNCLDAIITRYRKGLLPIGYIDWHMDAASAIWTAKGRRKELAVFQQELAKYR